MSKPEAAKDTPVTEQPVSVEFPAQDNLLTSPESPRTKKRKVGQHTPNSTSSRAPGSPTVSEPRSSPERTAQNHTTTASTETTASKPPPQQRAYGQVEGAASDKTTELSRTPQVTAPSASQSAVPSTDSIRAGSSLLAAKRSTPTYTFQRTPSSTSTPESSVSFLNQILLQQSQKREREAAELNARLDGTAAATRKQRQADAEAARVRQVAIRREAIWGADGEGTTVVKRRFKAVNLATDGGSQTPERFREEQARGEGGERKRKRD